MVVTELNQWSTENTQYSSAESLNPITKTSAYVLHRSGSWSVLSRLYLYLEYLVILANQRQAAIVESEMIVLTVSLYYGKYTLGLNSRRSDSKQKHFSTSCYFNKNSFCSWNAFPKPSDIFIFILLKNRAWKHLIRKLWLAFWIYIYCAYFKLETWENPPQIWKYFVTFCASDEKSHIWTKKITTQMTN